MPTVIHILFVVHINIYINFFLHLCHSLQHYSHTFTCLAIGIVITTTITALPLTSSFHPSHSFITHIRTTFHFFYAFASSVPSCLLNAENFILDFFFGFSCRHFNKYFSFRHFIRGEIFTNTLILHNHIIKI